MSRRRLSSRLLAAAKRRKVVVDDPSSPSPTPSAASKTDQTKRSRSIIVSNSNHNDAADIITEIRSPPPAIKAPIMLSQTEDVAWFRMVNSGLIGGFNTSASKTSHLQECLEIARRHIGVQGQESNAAFLSIWQRLSCGAAAFDNDSPSLPSTDDSLFTVSACKEMIVSGAGLIRIWGQRKTLHLYDVADWPVISAAFGDAIIAAVRGRCGRGDVIEDEDASHKLDEACSHVRDVFANSPSTVRFSRHDLIAAGYDVRLRPSQFMCSCFEGVGSRVDVNNRVSILAPRSFVAPSLVWQRPDQAQALLELAERYFGTYGPAAETDMRYFLAVSAASSKAAVKTLKDSGVITAIATTGDDGRRTRDEFVLTARLSSQRSLSLPTSPWPVRLLGRFDPLVLAHQDKSCWIDPANKRDVWSIGAHVHATVLVRGRIVGTWSQRRSGSVMNDGLIVTIRLFDGLVDSVTASDRDAIYRQAVGIASFFETALSSLMFGHDQYSP